MSDKRISLRTATITGGVSAMGAVLGVMAAKLMVPGFAGPAAWKVAAIVVGTLAVLVLAALIAPLFLHKDRRKKEAVDRAN